MNFTKTLCGAIALTSGIPIPPAELAKASYSVSEDGDRSFCVANGTAILRFACVDGDSDLLSVPLCSRIAKVLTKYLTIVVPVISTLLFFRFGKDCQRQHKSYSTYLFVRSGEVFTCKDVEESLDNVTSAFCGIGLTPSDHRNVVYAILFHIIREDPTVVRRVFRRLGQEEGDSPGVPFELSLPVEFARIVDIGRKIQSFYNVGAPELTAGIDGKVGCLPNEGIAVSSLISVSFVFHLPFFFASLIPFPPLL